MKYILSQLAFLAIDKKLGRNIRLLLRFILLLAVIVVCYSLLFHVLMLYEGRDYSWLTGLYWTLTVMSTLGFGDITFHTDLGLFFSIIVLLTGVVYLLIMLPFTFIQFFYAPWLEAQSRLRTPRELPKGSEGHVILTHLDGMSEDLVGKMERTGLSYVVLVDDSREALRLHDLGYRVAVGDYGDPLTYQRLQVDRAALVVANKDDMINTSITFTVREVSESVPIVTSADEEHSVDILEYAGSSHVFQFMNMLGSALGRRTIGNNMGAEIIWQHGELLIAEAPVMHTDLENKTLALARLREKIGVTVVGFWERGVLRTADPHRSLTATMILVLTGSIEQMKRFDSVYAYSRHQGEVQSPVLILGGGRVGKAASENLKSRGIPYTIVEKSRAVVQDDEHAIRGNAADIAVLTEAGIGNACSVLITTHNDDMNVYLTLYCRRLRPDLQIISRANDDKTVSKLYRAGADLVMSYASMASNLIMNLLTPDKTLTAVEGMTIFRVRAGEALAGKSLLESRVREKSGCSVAAVTRKGQPIVTPDPALLLEAEDELLLIGAGDAQERFFESFA